MAVDNIPVNVANKFSLNGKLDGREIIITYSTIDGPFLTLQRPPSDALLEFSGKQIVKQVTEIGTLVTIVLEQPSKPEGTEVQLSVLLPLVNLGPVGETNPVEADVKTDAILTTKKVGIVPQLVGQIQTYKFIHLTGGASFQKP